MRWTLLGGGMMGSACARYLLRWEDTEKLTIVERDGEVLSKLKASIKDNRVKWIRSEIKESDEFVDIISGSDAVISALPYRVNIDTTKACIRAGVNMCDMGGNNDVVKAQLALNNEAESAGITIVPDCSLAPGLSNIIASRLISQFDRCDEVHLRVGGLPLNPVQPFNYQLVFSVSGLVNEYVEPCKVLRDGKIMWVEPLSELEELEFGGEYGYLEAFHTSGGSSTLPETYQGVVRELDYKTIRYKGHCNLIKGLRFIGLADRKKVQFGSVEFSPREVLEALLEYYLPKEGDDVCLVYCWGVGEKDGEKKKAVYKFEVLVNKSMGLSAMMVGTSLPTVLVARFLAEGRVFGSGVKTPECA
ncbi:MAG: saccharopine dehydrogenase family protein [bacterium]